MLIHHLDFSLIFLIHTVPLTVSHSLQACYFSLFIINIFNRLLKMNVWDCFPELINSCFFRRGDAQTCDFIEYDTLWEIKEIWVFKMSSNLTICSISSHMKLTGNFFITFWYFMYNLPIIHFNVCWGFFFLAILQPGVIAEKGTYRKKAAGGCHRYERIKDRQHNVLIWSSLSC